MTTLATIAIASTAVSAGGAAIASIQRGNAEAEMARRQAQAQERSAVDALARGAADEGTVRMRASMLAARQRVALAGAGVTADSGSSLGLLEGTAKMSELDALTVRNNALREAWGFKVDAASSRLAGDVAKSQGYFEAAGSIFQGLGQAASIGASELGRLRMERAAAARTFRANGAP